MIETIELWFAEHWYKVVISYEKPESPDDLIVYLNFKIYEIEGLDEENIKNSKVSSDPDAEGRLKWDGCMDMNSTGVHFCGTHRLDQFHKAIGEIYNFGIEKLGFED